jgi:two-component system, OmpR family, alkaline phosphatase synthesis response regulator PhoP
MIGDLILLVDDEPNILQLARLYLEREGFRTYAVGDGISALKAVEEIHPAFMILDIMLPELDGFGVCRRLRERNDPIPILMLTARDDDIDKILGLELGADDYLTKPFNPLELVARVKAILRRDQRNDSTSQNILKIGDVTVNIASHEVFCQGKILNLRFQEFEVLRILIDNTGRVLSREQLLNLAWGYDFMGQTRTVDVHIAQLRRKLAQSSLKIETITNIGYKLVA